MRFVKKLIIVIPLVAVATLLGGLSIKLFMDDAFVLFDIWGFFAYLTLPVLMFFFDKKADRKRLIITSILFPLIMAWVLYLT